MKFHHDVYISVYLGLYTQAACVFYKNHGLNWFQLVYLATYNELTCFSVVCGVNHLRIVHTRSSCGLELCLEQFITPHPILTESSESMWHTRLPVTFHFASAWRYSVAWTNEGTHTHTQIHTHAHTYCGESNRRTTCSNPQTSDSSHAGNMPFLQRARWQKSVCFAAVPDVDLSGFELTPDTAQLFIPLLFFLHFSSALSCTLQSRSLDLSACCPICYRGAVGFLKNAELCRWSVHETHCC